jgi:hypothetical protein
VSFKLFEHLLNGVAPSGILKVPTTNRLLDLNSELVHGLNLQIIGLELVKVDALEHL